MGPFFKEIGGKGIALTIFAFTLIAFFNCDKVIVEIKLMIVWLDLNFRSFMILSPTLGVTDKKTQLDWSIICWLSLDITIFLNFLFKPSAIFLFLDEIIIFLKGIFELHIPIITEDAILPVPIKPKFILIL